MKKCVPNPPWVFRQPLPTDRNYWSCLTGGQNICHWIFSEKGVRSVNWNFFTVGAHLTEWLYRLGRAYFNDDFDVAAILVGRYHFMAIHAAPGRNIVQNAWVGGQYFQGVAYVHVLNGVLGFDDGHRAK